MIVIMSVNPGFGGQKFIPNSLAKIKELRDMIDKKNHNIDIQVDGGITVDNIGEAAGAGANVFVGGNGIYGTPDYKKTIETMRERCRKL